MGEIICTRHVCKWEVAVLTFHVQEHSCGGAFRHVTFSLPPENIPEEEEIKLGHAGRLSLVASVSRAGGARDECQQKASYKRIKGMLLCAKFVDWDARFPPDTLAVQGRSRLSCPCKTFTLPACLLCTNERGGVSG